jgi:Co/Zn/Cd efflux system component/copper chaperone CopZ
MSVVTYRVTGMDCPSCVKKIEDAARQSPGVSAAEVSLAGQSMAVTVDDEAQLSAMEQAISGLGYRLQRMRASSEAIDDDDALPDLSHVTPAYRRALWIVVLLNVGYGVAELIGGFLARSQAVKADALDFLGDGLISFLGLVALTWSARLRARAALLQGFFLAALGLGVVGVTIYRVFVQQAPEAPLMGALGLVALVINVAAVLVLLPHRGGDANMRAVWLFSRNDAIGNAAVVVAAGLVAWTGSAWPDLIVAFVVASLFLHSAWSIILDARRELAGKRA